MNGILKQYWFRGDRFLFLLVALVATLIVLPAIESPGLRRFVGNACLTLVFVTGALANRHRRVIFRLAVAIATVTIVLTLGRFVGGISALDVPRLIADIAFFAFTAVMILVSVIRDHIATRHAVYGAICVYLLMGLGWAHGYLLIERIDPEPFYFFVERHEGLPLNDERETTALSQMVYYSFVTMTTLGFGDITPRSPMAQTVTWMQAVAGQLFLAVLIARLVGALPGVPRGE